MNWLNWWIPLFTLFIIAVVLPPWYFFVSHYTSDLPIHLQFFANLVLPALAAIFLAGWVDPAGG